MKFATATTATLLVGAFALAFDAAAAADCSTPEWGKCGDANGATCCPGGQYCHPYTPTFYQCQKTPSQCPTQLTSIDLEGNDLGKAQAGTGEECCNACAKEPKCKAYTFVHYNNDGPQCYLKSAAGKQVSKVGAVSGVVSGGAPPSPTPPTPTPTTPTISPAPPTDVCATKPWAPCGDEKKSFCCPTGQYCQPWSPGSYQCMKIPDACPTQLTDIDFPGNDIGKAQAGTTDECCAACTRDARCKAYTFVNFNNDGPQCYLKSSAGDGKGQRKVGAVSGRR